MNWTDRRALRGQLQRAWDCGKLLAEAVTGESSFPWRLTFKRPTSAQMADDFAAVRAWIADLRALPHYRIECTRAGTVCWV